MIEKAARRTARWAWVTPVMDWVVTVGGEHLSVTLKLELLQHTGSFKPRGAFNRILAAGSTPRVVITASGGNHGLAVRLCRPGKLGHRADFFLPEITPQVKVDGIRALGAETVVGGSTYAEAAEASLGRAAGPGALYVHAYDQVEVVAGQGTLGRELEHQRPGLTTVLEATGGGGLIGGIAAWYGRRAQ